MPSTSSIILVSLVVAIAIFINYPSPPLTGRIKKWKQSGQYFEYKGHNRFYKESKGSGRDEDILMIFHGFPSSSYDYNKIWDDLTKMFGKVVVLDFLGYGLSDKPLGHNYLMVEHADSVEFLLKKLGHKRYHILSHDMGDTVAQELIHRQNKLTEAGKKGELEILSVCLMNGGIIPETIDMRLLQKVMLNPWLAPIAMRLSNRIMFKKGFGEVFGEKTQPTPEEFDDYYSVIGYNDGHLVTNDLIQYLPQRFANRDKWVGALEQTKIPLHIIFGPSDPVNPHNTFLKRYKELVPHSGVTELPSHISHYPHLEYPEGVVKAYKQFFESWKRNEASKKQE
ncbi:mesoderm-specific transcript protein-like [Amphiura filiformis]|uniref:mesoderm-specific transcript protein-like n=1 Tax=Amphiura filiformis TaxID=82378 RepID=UPI003B211A9E